MRTDPMENRKPSFFKRFLAVLLVTLLLLGVAAYGVLYVLLKGPSLYAGGLFADAVEDTALGSAVLHLFLTDEEIHREQHATGVDSEGCDDLVYPIYPGRSEE